MKTVLLLVGAFKSPGRPNFWVDTALISDESRFSDFGLTPDELEHIGNALNLPIYAEHHLVDVAALLAENSKPDEPAWRVGYEAARTQALGLCPWREHLAHNPLVPGLDDAGHCVEMKDVLIRAMQPHSVLHGVADQTPYHVLDYLVVAARAYLKDNDAIAPADNQFRHVLVLAEQFSKQNPAKLFQGGY